MVIMERIATAKNLNVLREAGFDYLSMTVGEGARWLRMFLRKRKVFGVGARTETSGGGTIVGNGKRASGCAERWRKQKEQAIYTGREKHCGAMEKLDHGTGGG